MCIISAALSSAKRPYAAPISDGDALPVLPHHQVRQIGSQASLAERPRTSAAAARVPRPAPGPSHRQQTTVRIKMRWCYPHLHSRPRPRASSAPRGLLPPRARPPRAAGRGCSQTSILGRDQDAVHVLHPGPHHGLVRHVRRSVDGPRHARESLFSDSPRMTVAGRFQKRSGSAVAVDPLAANRPAATRPRQNNK